MVSSEAEQRELRRRKILENAKTRIDRIMNVEGVTGKPPCIEGLQVSPCVIAKEEMTDEETVDPDTTVNGSLHFLDKTAELKLLTDDPILAPDTAEYRVEEKQISMKSRYYRVALMGIITRLLMIVNLSTLGINLATVGIVMPWIAYEIICEIHFRFSYEPSRWPAHGHVVDFLLSFGFSPTLTMVLGRMAEIWGRITDDFVFWLTAFLLSHSVVSAVSHLI